MLPFVFLLVDICLPPQKRNISPTNLDFSWKPYGAGSKPRLPAIPGVSLGALRIHRENLPSRWRAQDLAGDAEKCMEEIPAIISWCWVFPLSSGKLTWQWKSTFPNRKYIYKWWIYHSCVRAPQCVPFHCLQLVGGFNPSEKYARQIWSSPQVGVKIKNIWNHHLGKVFLYIPGGAGFLPSLFEGFVGCYSPRFTDISPVKIDGWKIFLQGWTLRNCHLHHGNRRIYNINLQCCLIALFLEGGWHFPTFSWNIYVSSPTKPLPREAFFFWVRQICVWCTWWTFPDTWYRHPKVSSENVTT